MALRGFAQVIDCLAPCEAIGSVRIDARGAEAEGIEGVGGVEVEFAKENTVFTAGMTIAGVGSDDSGGGSRETLLMPVATRDTALLVVHRLMPGLDLDALDWHRAPARARRRSPIQAARLAVAWDGLVLAARRGRVTRRLSFVPHARTQSMRVTQGPWERLLGLATVHVDVTPGPVRVRGLHLDETFARRVADEQAERARRARGTDASIRWAVSE